MTIVDPRIEDLLAITAGAEYTLARAGWRDPEEANGAHHILVDVLDEEGDREVGAAVVVFWADGSTTLIIEEKPGEPFGANFPMYATLGSYGARVGDCVVSGMGLGTPQEPNIPHHTVFELVFEKSP